MGYFPEFARLMNIYLYKKPEHNQSWLAERLKVTPTTVNRWLDGSSRPSTPEMVIRIADLLGVYEAEKRQELLVAVSYGYVEVIIEGPLTDQIMGIKEVLRIQQIRTRIVDLFQQVENTPFADHGLAHTHYALTGFEALIKTIKPTLVEPLHSLEIFIAEVAILLHNVGLWVTPLSSSFYLAHQYPDTDLDAVYSAYQTLA
jgi:transcriptional regulator with XRE-family HTH domain